MTYTTDIYVNRQTSDELRRQRLFADAIFLYAASEASTRIIHWARSLIDEAYGDSNDARRAHVSLSRQEFAKRAAQLKSRFTNHEKTKQLCQDLIVAMGSDPDATYFDLPRLRVAPPGSYLTTGVSYAYKPHRYTWYAHPRQLVNCCTPVFDSERSTVMSMHVDYFRKPVQNASDRWDYDEWIKLARFSAVENIDSEQRPHPIPLGDLGDTTNLRIAQYADDLMVFSTCHLHGAAPNETDHIRYSVDLRTLCLDDLRQNRGPQNLDGHATGSTLGDFLRVRDLQPLQPLEIAS